jgi:hypothetical protein
MAAQTAEIQFWHCFAYKVYQLQCTAKVQLLLFICTLDFKSIFKLVDFLSSGMETGAMRAAARRRRPGRTWNARPGRARDPSRSHHDLKLRVKLTTIMICMLHGHGHWPGGQSRTVKNQADSNSNLMSAWSQPNSVNEGDKQPFANAIRFCFASAHSTRKDLSKGMQLPTFFSSRREPADDTTAVWSETVVCLFFSAFSQKQSTVIEFLSFD